MHNLGKIQKQKAVSGEAAFLVLYFQPKLRYSRVLINKKRRPLDTHSRDSKRKEVK